MVIDSCNHETYGWPQIYEIDPEFTTTYQMLGTNATVTNFHLKDGSLCRLSHIFIPSTERVKLIWESHYIWVESDLDIEKTVAMLQKHLYWPKIPHEFNKYIRSCTSCVISKPTTKKHCLHTSLPTPNRP
jgi:hypothetical protein